MTRSWPAAAALAVLAFLATPDPVLAHGGHPLGGRLLELSLGSAALALLSAGLGAFFGRRWTGQGWMAAFGLGLLLWLFLDLVDESARLGRESLDPAYQASLVGAFLLGALLLAGTHHLGGGRAAAWLPALLWSVGVAFHTFGEGVVAGHEAVRGTHLLEVAWTQSLSYALHKVAEGFTVGLLLPRSRGWRWPSLLALVMGLPVAAGGLLGPSLGGVASVYAFALGGGAALYPLTLIGRQAFNRASPLGATLGLAAGVLALYAAGVIHQY